jgi:prepilin-type processing-associated H-X9-DG protein
VISIIALLVGILLPALGAARRSAQSIVCMSNCRQIGVASTTYTADNADYFVRYREVYSPGGWRGASHGSWWTSKLFNLGYMPELKGFTCPTLESNKEILDADPDQPQQAPWTYSEYGMNSSNIGIIQRQSGFVQSQYTYPGTVPSGPTQGASVAGLSKSARIPDLLNPSHIIYFTDSYDNTPVFVSGVGLQLTQAGTLFVFDYSETTRRYGRVHPRHNLGANTTFADGHAEPLKLTAGDVDPFKDSAEMYGSADPSGYSENELSDARLHENNRWSIDGKPRPGGL